MQSDSHTITITAFKRPHYFEKLLASLVKNRLEGWRVYIQLEPSDQLARFQSITESYLPPHQYSLTVNPRILGVRQNPFHLLSSVFDAGSSLNIYLEEDMVVSPDLIAIANWYRTLDLAHVMCANLMLCGCGSSGVVSVPERPRDFVKSQCFNSLGFIATDSQWSTHFAPNWNRVSDFLTVDGDPADGWDLSIYDYLISTADLRVLSPLLARANHIGLSGTHCTEQFHIKTFEALPTYQGTESLTYTIRDPADLPYAVTSHLHLWEDLTRCLATLKRTHRPRGLIQLHLHRLLSSIPRSVRSLVFRQS